MMTMIRTQGGRRAWSRPEFLRAEVPAQSVALLRDLVSGRLIITVTLSSTSRRGGGDPARRQEGS
jgi:hypothetical protein